MKTSRYTDTQIMSVLKQAEEGVKVPELCCEYGMSSRMFYRWRSKYSGMDTSMMKRMKKFEAENINPEKEMHNQTSMHSCWYFRKLL